MKSYISWTSIIATAALCMPLMVTAFAGVTSSTRTAALLSVNPNGHGSLSPWSRHPIKTSSTRRQAFALDNVAMEISSFYEAQPYVAAFMTCGFQASAADFMAQQKEEPTPAVRDDDATTVSEQSLAATLDILNNNNEMDVSRNLGFLFYGGLYQGMVQNWMYTQCYPQLFGSMGGPTWHSVAAQVGMEMFVMGPFLCLPVAYIVKAMFTTTSNSTSTTSIMPSSLSLQTLQDSLNKYLEDIKVRNLLLKYWALWIPVNSMVFSIIPSHFRVAFVALVSFFWVIILSCTSADTTTTTTEPTTTAEVTTEAASTASFSPCMHMDTQAIPCTKTLL